MPLVLKLFAGQGTGRTDRQLNVYLFLYIFEMSIINRSNVQWTCYTFANCFSYRTNL